MEHRFCAETKKIRIRPLREEDIEFLRQWRNDVSLSRYLREIPYITPEMQLIWFEKYKADNDTLFFAVIDIELDKVVGSVAIYDLETDTCEIGKIVVGDPSAHGKGIGYQSLLLAMAVAVERFHVKTIKLDVHEENVAARSIYNKAGFKTIGSHEFKKGGKELEMQITSDEFASNNNAVKIRVFEEDTMGQMDKPVSSMGGGTALNKCCNALFGTRRCSA